MMSLDNEHNMLKQMRAKYDDSLRKRAAFDQIAQLTNHSDPEAVVAEVRRVFEALPVTRDGVRAVPRMELFYPDPASGEVASCMTGSFEKYDHTNSAGPYPVYVNERACYSTEQAAREAAAAAKGGG